MGEIPNVMQGAVQHEISSESSSQGGCSINSEAPVSLVDSLRVEFLALDQKLVGDIKRDVRRDSEIQDFVEGFIRRRNQLHPGFENAAKRLLHRFEVMCARLKREELPSLTRALIYQELLDQFSDNVTQLGLEPAKLVTATLLSREPLSAVACDPNLQPVLDEYPWLLLRALTSNPRNVRGFLEEGIERLAEIREHLAATGESITARARYVNAFNHRSRPVSTLIQDRQKLLDDLKGEPEFTMLLSLRSSIAQEIVDNHAPNRVRPRLRHILLTVAKVLANDDFREFRNTPGDVVTAAIHRPHDSETFLREVLEQEARLKKLLGSSSESMTPRELRNMCLDTPLAARKLELRLSAINVPLPRIEEVGSFYDI